MEKKKFEQKSVEIHTLCMKSKKVRITLSYVHSVECNKYTLDSSYIAREKEKEKRKLMENDEIW